MEKIETGFTSAKRKRIVFLAVLLILVSVSGISQGNRQKGNQPSNSPVFTDFVYQGNDKVYSDFPLKPDEFYNPVLQGCYPDPSITRKGDDYYLVCSSFAMFPGVPIFHSKDLVNWTQIGHVLDRKSQLIVHDCGISSGIYAPQILYNPNNDTFYMITTQISGGIGNMVVKTKDPLKGWSDPIKLEFNGIDPSLFFDDNGKAYVVHNDAPDRGKELYNGHRVIKIWEYDAETDKVIAGTDKIIVDGGVDLTKKPIWIEAPHIYKKTGSITLCVRKAAPATGTAKSFLSATIRKDLTFLRRGIRSLLNDISRKKGKTKWTGPVTPTWSWVLTTKNITEYSLPSARTKSKGLIQAARLLFCRWTGRGNFLFSKTGLFRWNLN